MYIYVLGCLTVASAPSGLTAVQDGLTSILVSWSPPDPLGDTTGYRIDYTSIGGSGGSVPVDGGSTNSYHLTGLQINGESLHIAIIATSSHFFSLPMEVMSTTLCKIWGGGGLHSYSYCVYIIVMTL